MAIRPLPATNRRDDVTHLERTDWLPGDPVYRDGGAPELYCACGVRIAGPNLEPGPCPECGQRLTFDPTACLDRWRELRDQAEAERDAMRPVVEAARAWRQRSAGSILGDHERPLAAAVDALDGAS